MRRREFIAGLGAVAWPMVGAGAGGFNGITNAFVGAIPLQ
jgi:hypothetical protein